MGGGESLLSHLLVVVAACREHPSEDELMALATSMEGRLWVTSPPVATLGARSGSAAHRLVAICHSLALLAGDVPTFQILLAAIRGICTDFGVESLICKVVCTDSAAQ